LQISNSSCTSLDEVAESKLQLHKYRCGWKRPNEVADLQDQLRNPNTDAQIQIDVAQARIQWLKSIWGISNQELLLEVKIQLRKCRWRCSIQNEVEISKMQLQNPDPVAETWVELQSQNSVAESWDQLWNQKTICRKLEAVAVLNNQLQITNWVAETEVWWHINSAVVVVEYCRSTTHPFSLSHLLHHATRRGDVCEALFLSMCWCVDVSICTIFPLNERYQDMSPPINKTK
jgi:hypothetical protein